jgi:hypothetical protein
MKTLLIPLTCLVLLFSPASRADDLPFFSPLREEIVNQLTIVSNTVPLNKKLNSSLIANLKTLDKTKPTLLTGSAALGTLAKALGKTTLSNTFLLIVTDIRTVYIDTMETEMDALEDRLADTIPGKAQTVAQTAINKLAAALENAETNANLTLSLKSLSAAAKALGTADKAVAKAETAKPGPDSITVTIAESGQGVTTLKPLKKSLEAYYDDFSGEIEIDVAELTKLRGGQYQARFLEMTAAVPGEGTHTLSLTNEAYAIYQRIVSPSLAEFEEEEPDFDFIETFFTIDPINHALGTGTLNITVDFDANLVWGTYSFTANGSENTALEATVTGSFLVRLSTYEEFP